MATQPVIGGIVGGIVTAIGNVGAGIGNVIAGKSFYTPVPTSSGTTIYPGNVQLQTGQVNPNIQSSSGYTSTGPSGGGGSQLQTGSFQAPQTSNLLGQTSNISTQVSQQSISQLSGASASQIAAQQRAAQQNLLAAGGPAAFIPVGYSSSGLISKLPELKEKIIENKSDINKVLKKLSSDSYLQSVSDYGLLSGTLRYAGEESKKLIKTQKLGPSDYTGIEMRGTGIYNPITRKFEPTLTPGSLTIAQREAIKTEAAKQGISATVQIAPYLTPVGNIFAIGTGIESLAYPKARSELTSTAKSLGLPEQAGYLLSIAQIGLGALGLRSQIKGIETKRINIALERKYDTLGASTFIQPVKGKEFNIIGKQMGENIQRTFMGAGITSQEGLSTGTIGATTIGKITYKDIFGRPITKGFVSLDISEAGSKILPKSIRQNGNVQYGIVKGGEYPLLSSFTTFQKGENTVKVLSRLNKGIKRTGGTAISFTESLSQPLVKIEKKYDLITGGELKIINEPKGITKIRTPEARGLNIERTNEDNLNILLPSKINKTPLSKTFGETVLIQKAIQKLPIPKINIPKLKIQPVIKTFPLISATEIKPIKETLSMQNILFQPSESIQISAAKQIEQQKISSKQIQENKDIQKLSILDIQTPIEIQRESQSQRQVSIQREEQKQKQPEILKESLLNPTILKEENRLKIPKLIIPTIKKASSLINRISSKLPTFRGYTIRRKKEILISESTNPLIVKRATEEIARRTLARTVIVKDSIGKPIKLIASYGFRPSKLRVNAIVQINPLSARSETKEIQEAKKSSANRFKSSKGFTKERRIQKVRL